MAKPSQGVAIFFLATVHVKELNRSASGITYSRGTHVQSKLHTVIQKWVQVGLVHIFLTTLTLLVLRKNVKLDDLYAAKYPFEICVIILKKYVFQMPSKIYWKQFQACICDFSRRDNLKDGHILPMSLAARYWQPFWMASSNFRTLTKSDPMNDSIFTGAWKDPHGFLAATSSSINTTCLSVSICHTSPRVFTVISWNLQTTFTL